MVITIDGPTGAGKSTISKQYAKKHGFIYINSGAFYRTVSYFAMCNHELTSEKIIPDDMLDKYISVIIPNLSWINDEMQISYKDGEETIDMKLSKELFNSQIDVIVPFVSAQQSIRKAINNRIRAICKSEGKWIIEGRDAGTIIMPDTPYKFYLDASLAERAKRRSIQYNETNTHKTLEAVKLRDKTDQNKGEASLKKLDTYHYIDTTNHAIDEIINKMYNIVNSKV